MTTSASVAIPNWLDVASRNHPDTLALAFGDVRWTFAELHHQVTAAAGILANAMPVGSGRIGIISSNRPGFIVAVHAAARLRVPFVPLNWRLSDSELSWQIQDAGITLLVADEARDAVTKFASANLGAAVFPVADLEPGSPEAPPAPCAQGAEPGARVTLHDEAAIIYTSGTSGRPKGVIITYGNLWFAAVSSALHLGHRADDVWLATMPLFHVGGLAMLFRSVIGATPLMLHDRFDPQRALQAIEDGATLVSLVPTMLERMLDVRGDAPWPAHLRCILLGGSAAPPRLLEACLRLGIPIAPTYGLTEAASQVTTLLPDQLMHRIGSSGQPLPLTEVRITSPQGAVAAGETGEIEIRGSTIFAGYVGAANRRKPHEWFATGDVGYLNADGFLYVVDRRHDLIVSGGENIYPAEIERVLRTHPLVADAGVVGVPHETWGARPAAVVVWIGDPEAADGELRDYCARELSSYKIPDRIVLAAELPRTPSGKLLRRELSERIASR